MYSYFNGTLASKTPMMIVLECNKIGYEIRVPISTYEKLGTLNSEVRLFVQLVVSDDDMRLYGFYTEEEREIFMLLTSVSGIGPKIALSVLSTMSVGGFLRAVKTENDNAITIVPGLGKKTAQRLILELKDKVANLDLAKTLESFGESKEQLTVEAETALVTLGYKPVDIRNAFEALLKAEDIESSELLIKKTIQYLYQDRNTGRNRKSTKNG